MLTEAWRVAEDIGLPKAYDAEFVALAGLLSRRFVTLDRRLRRACASLCFAIGPSEL